MHPAQKHSTQTSTQARSTTLRTAKRYEREGNRQPHPHRNGH